MTSTEEKLTDSLLDLARQLGARIVKLRKNGGLNQQQLATRAQISKAMLSTIENGQRIPSVDLLRRLAIALGLSAEQSLVQQDDAGLYQMWTEVYEGQSSVSIQLRAGHDLKLPPPSTPAPPIVQEAELISPEPTLLMSQLLAVGEAQRDLSRSMAEAASQSVRHFTGVAHHLDKVLEQLDHVNASLKAQTEALLALRRDFLEEKAQPAPPPPVCALGAESADKLLSRTDNLAAELTQFQRTILQMLRQNQTDAHTMRVRIAEIMQSMRRR